ncbi:MAG: OadG family protein [Clostridia bacterium]|nr:OadG family protein [Clostridia bacterium]
MSIGTGVVYSLLGIAVVFAALTMLMVIVILLYRLTTPKAAAAPERTAAPAQTQEIVEFGFPEAPGSAGGVKLYDTPERDAAMVMAIVANNLGKPLNELRFLSIKRIDAENGGSDEV